MNFTFPHHLSTPQAQAQFGKWHGKLQGPPEGSRGEASVEGLEGEVFQKPKNFYNSDVEFWANFVVYFCFSVF